MRNKSFIKHIRDAKEEGRQEGIDFTVVNYSAALLLCLKDKFDFTTAQLEEVALRVNELFNDICNDLLSLEDVVEVLKEENRIDLLVNGKNPYVNQRVKAQPLEFKVLTSQEEEYRKRYIEAFDILKNEYTAQHQYNMDPALIDILQNHRDSKEELERNLRKAGYLDE